MKITSIIIALCAWLITSCKKENKIPPSDKPEREVYVGMASSTSSIEEWPYRYTLVRENRSWTGEIEYIDKEFSIYFDSMSVVSSTDDRIVFGALLGGPGKALPCDWELSLVQSDNGFKGVLVATNIEDFEPIELDLVEKPKAVLPSTRLDKDTQQ